MSENKLNTEELKKVFIDVRKSYRLLYEHQRRVQDLVRYIGDYYGYSCNPHGRQWFSEKPANKNFDLKRLAWEVLGIYMFDFHFKSKEKKGQKITFSAIHQADTGFFDAKNRDEKISKIDVSSFEPVENSTTRLIFLASSNGWLDSSDQWKKLFGWKNGEHEFSASQSRWQNKDEANNQLAIAYNLEEFLNQETTNQVLENFGKECEDFGIPILEKEG